MYLLKNRENYAVHSLLELYKSIQNTLFNFISFEFKKSNRLRLELAWCLITLFLLSRLQKEIQIL